MMRVNAHAFAFGLGHLIRPQPEEGHHAHGDPPENRGHGENCQRLALSRLACEMNHIRLQDGEGNDWTLIARLDEGWDGK